MHRLILFVFGSALICVAQPLPERMHRHVLERVERGDFSGSVLAAKQSRVVFARSYGLANREHNVPNTPQTRFRIGSITKTFTAAAILRLEEEGKLTINDPVCQHIEDCPAAWQSITVHHLLSHTSGIFNFTNDPAYPRTWMIPSRPLETIVRFRDRPLEFEPGKKFRYSNSGYVVLAAVVEKASGESYESYVSRNIFRPAGMKDSGHDSHAEVVPHRASGYWLQFGRVVNAAYHDMTIPLGGGNLYSTVEDLFRWDQALYTDSVLTAASRRKMFRRVKDSYGYGWRVEDHLGRRRFGHGGAINGFTSVYFRYPAERAAVIVLSNHSGAPAANIAENLAAVLFGEAYGR
jgi:CubicO group peptidase (beta-lactamase class C family)